MACAAIDHHHLMSDLESDIVAGNGRERLHNTRRDGLSPCRHPGRQCQATAGQRGTAEQIAAVQYRGHIISLFIVQHPLVHSEARARYLSHPYARARRTPQMSAKISASRTRARYSRVSTAFPLIESANAASDWFNPSTVRSRSEEHTSELQSLMRSSYAVFCLKKK